MDNKWKSFQFGDHLQKVYTWRTKKDNHCDYSQMQPPFVISSYTGHINTDQNNLHHSSASHNDIDIVSISHVSKPEISECNISILCEGMSWHTGKRHVFFHQTFENVLILNTTTPNGWQLHLFSMPVHHQLYLLVQ